MEPAWKAYAADFDALSDEEIERESDTARREMEEHEAWLDAVASWEQAGKPRNNQS